MVGLKFGKRGERLAAIATHRGAKGNVYRVHARQREGPRLLHWAKCYSGYESGGRLGEVL